MNWVPVSTTRETGSQAAENERVRVEAQVNAPFGLA